MKDAETEPLIVVAHAHRESLHIYISLYIYRVSLNGTLRVCFHGARGAAVCASSSAWSDVENVRVRVQRRPTTTRRSIELCAGKIKLIAKKKDRKIEEKLIISRKRVSTVRNETSLNKTRRFFFVRLGEEVCIALESFNIKSSNT